MLPRLRVSGPNGDSLSHSPSRPSGSQPRPRRRRRRRRLRPAAPEPLVVRNSAPKMAERAGTSLSLRSTSLRDLHERLASMAQEIPEEQQHKLDVNFSAAPKKKLTCTSVIDGSVIKNDIKQLLAKERREERKRQQEANKEKQLLEKERKAKLQYEKHLEEKQRKLKEQKEKDEQRRMSVEEKRKQKLAEDKEKFKAVVSRTMERCNRVDQRQKKWSWEGSLVNPESKSGKTENRSPSLSRRENKAYTCVDPVQMDNTSGVPQYVFRYVSVPMFTEDELKTSMMFYKPTVKRLFPTKLEITPPNIVETPPKEDIEVPTNVNMNLPPEVDVKVLTPTNVEVPLQVNIEDTPEVNVQIFPKANIEVPTEVNGEGYSKSDIQELTMVSDYVSPNSKLSPIASMDSSPTTNVGSSSLASVNISPIVSTDTSPETSIDTSLESSMELKSMEVLPIRNLGTSLESITEASSEPDDKTSPDVNGDESLQNSKTDKYISNLTAKKQPQSNILCNRWLSSTSLGWHPPSPIKNMQIENRQSPSSLPVTSKSSAPSSVPYKRTPIQNALYVPNAIDVVKKMKEILSKVKDKQAGSQTHMTSKESDNKIMPHRKETMKLLAGRQRPPYEQKDKEEKRGYQKEKISSVASSGCAVTKKAVEGQAEEFPTCKDFTRTGGREQLEDLEQQKYGGTTIRCQNNAEMCRKEHERMMLQNHQERLERRKRVEEIMKRTRKTVVNASKSTETSGKDTSKDGEADDEDETESDEDSSNDIFASGTKTSPTKFSKTAMRKPQELVFLQAKTGEIDTEKKIYFNGNVNIDRQKDPKAKGSRKSTKKKCTHTMRNRKAKEASSTVRYTESDSAVQWWGWNRFVEDTRPPAATTSPSSSNTREVKDTMTSLQGPEAPSTHRKQSRSTVPLSKVSPQLRFSPKTTNLNPFFSSRNDFGREEEDSD